MTLELTHSLDVPAIFASAGKGADNQQTMLIDGRTLPEGQVLTSDLCIIGAGAAGATAALVTPSAPAAGEPPPDRVALYGRIRDTLAGPGVHDDASNASSARGPVLHPISRHGRIHYGLRASPATLHPPPKHIKTIGPKEHFAAEDKTRHAEDTGIVGLQACSRQLTFRLLQTCGLQNFLT